MATYRINKHRELVQLLLGLDPPAKTAPTRCCNKCGLPIVFKKLPNGKYCPMNEDGTRHFDGRRARLKKSKRAKFSQ